MSQKPTKPSDDLVIWRYMGLDKFLDILLSETIKFTLASIASDKNEILWILKNLENSNEIGSNIEGARKHIKSLRNSTYISCWVSKEYESRSFWASYLDSTKQGVAIKTTIGDFIKAVDWDKFSFGYSVIEYRNEFKLQELQNNSIAINTKSTAYKDESELRFHISGLDEIVKYGEDPSVIHKKLMTFYNQDENPKKIISLKVNLDILISELMISPYSSEWQKRNILKLITDYRPDLIDKITNSIVNE